MTTATACSRPGGDDAANRVEAGAAPDARGVGIAEPGGRILWVDDAFCAVLGRSRAEVLDAGIADVLTLAPGEAAVAASRGGLLRIAGEEGAPALRVTPLGPGDRPTALVLQVDGPIDSEPGAPARGSVVAAFVLDGDGKVSGSWGSPTEVALFDAGMGSPEGGESVVTDLVARALQGEAANGLLLVDGLPREARCFPVEQPGVDRPAVVVAITTPANRRFRAAPVREDPQSGLARLARYALAGEGQRLLVEEAVRLVQSVLDAEVCAVFEFLPERRGALRLAEPFLPGEPATAPAAWPALGPGFGDLPEGLLIAAIDGPPAFGALAVQRRPGVRFDADDMLFVAGAADILAVALRRLAGEERQRHAALHDPLTALPNRALILDHLALALARAPRRPSPVGVIFLDLERFKLINDTLGHGAGDELLVAVAHRLARLLRPSDTLGRLGGDEFLIVCEDIGGEADALAVADRLAGAFDDPFQLAGEEVRVAASIGVAVSKPDSEPAALVGEADAAMYASKHTRRRVPVLFEERMRPAPLGRIVPGAPAEEGPTGDVPSGGVPGRGQLSGLVARLVGMLEDVGDAEVPGAERA